MTTGTKIFWIIFFILCLLINSAASFIKIKHIKRIKTAKKIYKKINNINNKNEGWLISYLRKIDPFVFEELILFAFKKNGFKIKRNKKYTHDGGIDGKIYRNKHKYLIQAKRYSDYINEQHVKDFIRICRMNKCCGYFIHTGKTGTETKELIKTNPQINLISGEKLYLLFIETNKKENLFFKD